MLAIAVEISVSFGSNANVDRSSECFVSYLKQQGMNDEYLMSMKSYDGVSDACQHGAELEKVQLLHRAQAALTLKDNAQCMYYALENHEKFKNLLLNARVFNDKRDFMNKMASMARGKSSLKELAVKRIDIQLRDILSEIEVKCTFSVDFSSLFDSIFADSLDDFVPYDDDQEFCIKKELSDSQVINLNDFSLESNPKKLHIDSLDCYKIMQPIKSNIIKSLKDFESENPKLNQKRCVFLTLQRENKYFYSLLKLEIISKLNLSFDQMQREKQKFVNEMTDIGLKIREFC